MTTHDPPVLDLRSRPPAEHAAAVWEMFAALTVAEAMLVRSEGDLTAVRQMLEVDYPGGFTWEQPPSRPGHVQITKQTTTALPHVVADTSEHLGGDRGGAVWNLRMQPRDLDANIVTLPAGDGIGAHTGPDLDVLVHVLAGTGHLHTETDPVELRAGLVLWLPRRSRRAFTAGQDGLTYLTVHRRRPPSGLWPAQA